MKKYLILALMAIMVVGISYAGDQFTVNGFNIGESGAINYRSDIDVVTATTDTVTSSESGTVFLSTATATTVFTLPAATTEGLIYTFVDGHGKTLSVDPASTSDTIEYLTLSAGDKISSSGATGDSVTLVTDGSNSWYVVTMDDDDWTDGN